MSEPAKLPNPFEGAVFGPDFRLNVEVNTVDILTIKSVSPSRGTVQHLVAGFVKSIADQLRAEGINYYTPDNCARFCAIVEERFRRGLGPVAAGTASGNNVVGGKEGVRAKATHPPVVSTNAKGGTRKGVKGKG